jgi:hypothetical protein
MAKLPALRQTMARKAVMAVCIFVEGDRDSSVTLSRLSP